MSPGRFKIERVTMRNRFKDRDFLGYLTYNKRIVDTKLKEVLSFNSNSPELIRKAIEYAVFSGGKRIRPLFAIAAAEACRLKPEKVLPPLLSCVSPREAATQYCLTTGKRCFTMGL